MTTTKKISKADPRFAPILRATFPDYRGRKVRLVVADAYRLANFWDGGSRDYAVAYNLTTGEVAEPHPATTNPTRGGAAFSTVEIPEGIVIAERSYFCGKDLGITIYVNPANMPTSLTEGK